MHDNLFAAPEGSEDLTAESGAYGLRRRYLRHEGWVRGLGGVLFALGGGGVAACAVATLSVLVLVLSARDIVSADFNGITLCLALSLGIELVALLAASVAAVGWGLRRLRLSVFSFQLSTCVPADN